MRATVNSHHARLQGNTVPDKSYINKVDDSGWLRVQPKIGVPVYLCEYTCLQFLESKQQRSFFKVQDGNHKGLIVSLSDANAQTYLGKSAPIQHGAVITATFEEIKEVRSAAKNDTFVQQLAKISIGNIAAIGTLNTSSKAQPPTHSRLAPGNYRVHIPEYPHNRNMTQFYQESVEPNLKFHQAWFTIEFGDRSRFIHPGNVSHGCVTIMSLEKWNAIYRELIRHRIPGTNFVGHLMVK